MKITQKIVGFLGVIALAVSASLMASTAANAADIGTTWSNATLPSGVAGMDSVAFGAGVFIGVNADGDIIRSTDGKAWTLVEATNVTWTSAVFGGGVFVILGDDNGAPVFRRSVNNGVSFASASASGLNSTSYTGLSYGQNTFVAFDTTSNSEVAVSTDAGQSWSDGAQSDSGDEFQSSAFGNNMFVSVSTQPSIEFNSDPSGSSWNAVTFGSNVFPITGDTPSRIAFNGTRFMFLLLDTNGGVYSYTSTDGENWADGVSTVGLPSSEYSGLGWDGSAWLTGAGGTGTGIYRSVDGVTWTLVDANNTQWSAFALGNNIVVAGGQPQGSTAQGLNTTLAVGWSVPTVEPTVAPTPVTPTELPNTGMNPTSMTVSAAVAAFMIALGLVVLRRARSSK